MTAAQQSALDRITEIMREHFDSAVFAFEVEAGTDANPTLQHLSYRTAGSFSAGLGLLEYVKNEMLHDDRGCEHEKL
jgi:hypothetical protein